MGTNWNVDNSKAFGYLGGYDEGSAANFIVV